ncbi:MAG: hypothetical protein OXT65_11365 [Alphaproteobacteria bacterium]|nr:hypothetical protein [Alphaproteobacteria bacterium]
MNRFLFIFLSFCMFFPLPASGQAPTPCACTEKSFDIRWQQADAVLTATVTDITTLPKYNRTGQKDLPVAVTFDIQTPFKGVDDDKKTFTLHTSLTRHTCTGHPFEKGGTYLVFAYEREDFTWMPESLYRFPDGTFDVGGLCGGTKALDTARDDLAAIKAKLKKTKRKKGFFKTLGDALTP